MSVQAAEKFLQERMHGEGNTMRHLASMGYRLTYEQDPRAEFDYSITSLSTDLRSGVRLLRAAELLTGESFAESSSVRGATGPILGLPGRDETDTAEVSFAMMMLTPRGSDI